MENENTNASFLPLMALSEIPNPEPDAEEIVALKKEKGRVTGYQLSGGEIVSKQQGVQLARQGKIKHVGIAFNRGTPYLKSIPDKTENNNLGNLPSIRG